MDSIYKIFIGLFLFFPIFGMETSDKSFDKHYALQRQRISKAFNKALNTVQEVSEKQKTQQNLIKICSDDKEYSLTIDELFVASEKLLLNDTCSVFQKHPLAKFFESLKRDEGLSATLKSGPDIQDFTLILLDRHGLNISEAHQAETISLKLFNNVETFMRCLDIFKKAYKKYTGKEICCGISYSLSHIPLNDFCRNFVNDNPELKNIKSDLLERIVNLLSIFEIDNEIVSMNITLMMSIKEESFDIVPSFKPILLQLTSNESKSSNDISLGQLDLTKQIQNLNGSEISMPYIKDADGYVQFNALNSLLTKHIINILEIGGGRGETNAVFDALVKDGHKIKLLNSEPHEPFAKDYINAHKVIGIDDVDVIQKTAQQLSIKDVIDHFNNKVDVIFASHSFYFILGDLHKATQAYLNGDLQKIEDHPLYKYFEMLEDDGVLLVTLQSGAGARLFRNALLGNHGLNIDDKTSDKTTLLLKSFGNLATFLRHFEFFAKLYEKKFGRKIKVKTHYAVANVPLGDLKIKKDERTGGYTLGNPRGANSDSDWTGLKMMDFYGNWKELESLATLTFEEAQKLDKSDLKRLGLEELTKENLENKRAVALKTQETFLHILRVFAPGLVNMQHPNITLEITVESN